MEQARILIAIALSFLVFLLWEVFFVDKEPVQHPRQEMASQQEPIEAPEPLTKGSIIQEGEPAFTDGADEPEKPSRTIVIDTPLYRVKVSETGAVFESFVLKKYRETIDPDSSFLEMVDQNPTIGTVRLDFEKNSVADLNAAKFVAGVAQNNFKVIDEPINIAFRNSSIYGLTVEKSFTFSPDTYMIDLNITIKNGSDKTFRDNLVISLLNALPKDQARYGFVGPSALINNHLEKIKIKKIKDKNIFTGKLDWIAFQDRYFISSIIPKNSVDASLRLLTNETNFLASQYIQPAKSLPPGTQQVYQYQLYFGPKSTPILKSFNRGLDKAVDFGMFTFIAKPCVWLMNLLYSGIPNYGIAIIVLTTLIKIILWPLGSKSYKSMNEMKKIQPLMTEIREKYKDDKKKMNEEVMGLYRTYKVNPMGGCLPMLVQIPVFFALYRMLYEAIELRHAPFFGWINDLSAPDRLFRFDFSIPFMQEPYGIPVLTIIMGATMFLQQKMSPPMGDPAQAKMMMLMPVIFTFIFINFSSGLVLYWLVNNILSISQQYYIQKKHA